MAFSYINLISSAHYIGDIRTKEHAIFGIPTFLESHGKFLCNFSIKTHLLFPELFILDAKTCLTVIHVLQHDINIDR